MTDIRLMSWKEIQAINERAKAWREQQSGAGILPEQGESETFKGSSVGKEPPIQMDLPIT